MAGVQKTIWVGGKQTQATFNDDGTFTYQQGDQTIHAGQGADGKFYSIPEGQKFIPEKNGSFANDANYEQWRANNPTSAYNGPIDEQSYQAQTRSTNQAGVVTNGYGQVQWGETVDPRQYKQNLQQMRRNEYKDKRAQFRQMHENGKISYHEMRQFQRGVWKGTYGSAGGGDNQREQDKARVKAYEQQYRQNGLEEANKLAAQQSSTPATPVQQPQTQQGVQNTPVVSRPFDPNAPAFRFGGKLSYYDYLSL